MIRKIAAAVELLMCTKTLTGWHTVYGVGQDTEGGGGAGERFSGK